MWEWRKQVDAAEPACVVVGALLRNLDMLMRNQQSNTTQFRIFTSKNIDMNFFTFFYDSNSVLYV